MTRTAALDRLHQLVSSRVHNSYLAAPEAARGPNRKSGSKLALAVLSLCLADAYAAPLGGDVVSGSGSISPAGAVTTIRQSSANLSLTWQSFNVGTQETVNFVQPSASSIAVNRISDVNGSQILGNLNANGQVYLINPNGIVFGQGAQVNVGGLVASTLDFSDATLGDARLSFSGSGAASVINLGAIHAADGGSVALLGRTVDNQGSIVARLGTVALGAGSAATLTFEGARLVQMQIDSSVLDSAARNGGLIRADGGLVLMSAGAKGALLASVVNNTGVIEARTVESHDGEIVLLAGMAAGQTQVGGTLDASAPDGGNGGAIETSAAQVTVGANALVTTAAPHGATGTWLIDPYNLTISAAAGTTGGSFVANANDSVINATTLQTALATTNVTVTTGSSGNQAGNITVTAPLTWSAATTLGLTAAGAIAIDAPITITGAGGVNLTASAQTGISTTGLTFARGASIDYGATDHGGTFRLDGNSYTLVYSMAELDAIDGLSAVDGTALAAYGAGLNGNYALATSLVATGTTYTRALISTDSSNAVTAGFMGRLDGLGNTLTGLTINAAPMTNSVALVGSATNGSISDMGLVNASVSGYDNVAALVGYSWGETVQTSFADATVSGHKDVGGLVGGTRSFTLIQSSYSDGTVTGSQYTGGLVGDLNFTSALKTSYSTSAVSGVDSTGGLAGDVSLSTVLDSYSTGAVSGTTTTGGLIGLFNTSPSALVTGSFWDTQTSGKSTSGGGAGAVGLTTAQMQAQANFTSATTANGNVNPAWDLAGTWAIYNGQTMPLLRAFLTPLVVTANTTDKTYNDVAYSGVNGVTYSVTPNSANLFGSVSYADLSQGAVNAGSYAVTPSGLYSNQQGYAISYVAGGLVIAPATLTVAAVTAGRLYGAVDPAFSGSVTGFVGSDTLLNATTGTEVFTTPALTGSNVGTYAINGAGLSANNGNYVFAQAAGNATALTISPATLTVASNAASRLYGATDPLYPGSVTGFVGGDTLGSATTGTETFSTTAVVGSNVGSYAIDGSGLVANHGNYVFAQAAGNATALTITPATLTVASAAASRLYGATDPTFTGTVTGFVAGDTLGSATTGNETFTTTAQTNSNVGSYAVDGSGLAANHGNYVFAQAAGNATALTIAPATLTVASTAASRVYGATDPTFTGTVTGFVAGDTLGSATTGNETFTTTAQTNSNVGSYAVDGSGLAANHGNYVFAQAAGNATALTIAPATLTVTANAAGRIYGAADPAFSGSVSGFVAGDTLGSATTGSEVFTTTAVANSNVGSYAVTGTGLTANNGNYVFAQAAGNATALTIGAATLTVTSAAGTRLYGATDPLYTGSVTGFVGGDTLASATSGTEAFTTTAQTNSNVGNYAIDGSGLVANHGNYVFAQAAGNATALTITPATLTVASAAASRLYGATDPTFTGTVTGFVAGDTLGSATTGNETFTTTAQTNSNVGSYAVDGSGLAANHGNYVFAQAAGNATALTIAPATLTVTANAAGRIYGAADPAFSGSVSGFVAGDTLGSATTGSEVFTTTAVANSNVGSYAVTGTGLTANNGNYVFAQAAGNATALTIGAATLTVTSAAGTRLYGATDPLYTGSVTGFVAGDTLASATSGTEAFTTPAQTNSNIGNYAIDGSGLVANHGNYVFSQAAGNATALTVTPATLTLTSNPASRGVGAVDPVFSGRVTGFVAGDTQGSATTGSLTYSTDALADSLPGHYAIDSGGLSANNGNYVFVQAPGNATAFTIVPAYSTQGLESVLASVTQADGDAFFLGPPATPVVKTGRKIRMSAGPGTQVVQGGLRLPSDVLGNEQ